ncbi:hypothetical protein DV736_g3359, partial [Chaetothyriales sp. CBS 134916]
MAAPRASSFKVLRNLQKASPSLSVRRELHITGGHASPSRIDPTNKTTYTPWSLQDLRGECSKRSLSPSGTKHELIDRLAGHDSLQARAFSMAMRRITTEQTRKPIGAASTETAPRREFNTSRELKAWRDTSTVDFAYLPHLFEDTWIPQPAAIRVPILPHVESDDAEAILEKYPHLDAAAGGYQDTEGGSTQMKAEISIMTSDNSTAASAFSDVHDGHHATEMSVDTLTALTELVDKSGRRSVDTVNDQDQGQIRQLWQGLLDDLLGPKKK